MVTPNANGLTMLSRNNSNTSRYESNDISKNSHNKNILDDTLLLDKNGSMDKGEFNNLA